MSRNYKKKKRRKKRKKRFRGTRIITTGPTIIETWEYEAGYSDQNNGYNGGYIEGANGRIVTASPTFVESWEYREDDNYFDYYDNSYSGNNYYLEDPYSYDSYALPPGNEKKEKKGFFRSLFGWGKK